MSRTIKQALEHAEQQRGYPIPEAPDLITDFILLADELNRLCSYTCQHPSRAARDTYTAFMRPDLATRIFMDRGMMFDSQTVVEGDPTISDTMIHFPQPDGTCVRHNI